VPPARTVCGQDDQKCTQSGTVLNSVISGGCIVSGGTVIESVLSHNVHVEAGSVVEQSVLLDDVRIGRGSKLRKVIVDQGVTVPDGYVIGHDPEADKSRFTISPSGVVIVPGGISLR
jgi:glucose-1-phosphate adenylyltransferase